MKDAMKEIIENIYPMGATLLGSGYDNALEYLKHLLDFKIIEIPSGTKLGSWTVPDEWVVRDATVTYKGLLGDMNEIVMDYKKEPLSLMVYSAPFKGEITKEELENHLHYNDEIEDVIPYNYSFYEKNWGICLPKNKVKVRLEENIKKKGCKSCKPELRAIDSNIGSVYIDDVGRNTKWGSLLFPGKYEVNIDTEFKPGKLKIAVHTIQGKSEKEILLFAHLDHPYQANDNLSGVACLVDLANKIKCDHTVKIIFCPETIGSIAYCETQDISNVDFVMSVDICGNDQPILVQKTFNKFTKLDRIAHCALQMAGKQYRKAGFRSLAGSDENYFNDPKIGIPAIMISRIPYKEYHTNKDKPEIIDYDKIKEVQELILKIIEVYEKDYVPIRNFKGPLMRSRYGLHTVSKQLNLNYDYLIYSIDGEKSLAELCCDFELNFDYIHGIFEKIISDGFIQKKCQFQPLF